MDALKQKQLDLVNETVAFYNLKNRCAIGNKCLYYMEGKEGCAIGRKIVDVELRKSLDKFESQVQEDVIFDKLPIELQELGRDFLGVIQWLHDNSRAWNNEGLSQYGQEQVTDIITRFGLTDK